MNLNLKITDEELLKRCPPLRLRPAMEVHTYNSSIIYLHIPQNWIQPENKLTMLNKYGEEWNTTPEELTFKEVIHGTIHSIIYHLTFSEKTTQAYDNIAYSVEYRLNKHHNP